MFKVGDKATYPAHGLGIVKRIEKRVIGDNTIEFYVFHIIGSGATLMVPVEGVERAGMRPVATKDEIFEAMTILLKPASNTKKLPIWNRRFREFNDLMRNGNILDTAKVLRSIHDVKLETDLSYGEQKMWRRAFDILVLEIDEVLGKGKARILIENALEGHMLTQGNS